MKHFFFTIACSLAALCAQTQEIIDTVQVRVQYRATYKLRKKVHSPIPMPCHKAVFHFRGRTWTPWYTLDLPFDNGP